MRQNSPVIDLGLNFYTELLASHQLVLLRAEIKSELLSKDAPDLRDLTF